MFETDETDIRRMFETDIKAFENRIAHAAYNAIDEIHHGRYKAARMLLDEAIELEAAAKELEYQRSVLECGNAELA